MIAFANGQNGMAIMPGLVEQILPGDHPAFAWLDYPGSAASKSP